MGNVHCITGFSLLERLPLLKFALCRTASQHTKSIDKTVNCWGNLMWGLFLCCIFRTPASTFAFNRC